MRRWRFWSSGVLLMVCAGGGICVSLITNSSVFTDAVMSSKPYTSSDAQNTETMEFTRSDLDTLLNDIDLAASHQELAGVTKRRAAKVKNALLDATQMKNGFYRVRLSRTEYEALLECMRYSFNEQFSTDAH